MSHLTDKLSSVASPHAGPVEDLDISATVQKLLKAMAATDAALQALKDSSR